ncbi:MULTISPECIES: dUTP diphosphatase [Alteromonadaceae]|jgi:dimeric dUTPase (all-alpha-NTP-PPase superfamily)|uniref:dUTP diphosphatase n=1 Tax=Brumicola blandensis TaxID=3075611 RepID=A0AAW8QW26_9ALTE|nr:MULTISPECIES: dUTP diphosphatase [unclassified Alteromonas]MDT0581232.1 dUTP diphosphatase [Alteromonas sp. W409]MDT0626849.1 dUTP diphosphatase [Alteromonas sp. W364]
MLSETQLSTMLDLQDGMNKKVNPQWLHAGYSYLRAAMIESVEAIEHHGWKWWKAQRLDLPQVQMELVDIWHFALSHIIIQHNGNIQAAANELAASLNDQHTSVTFDGKNIDFASANLVENLELMAGLCVAKRFDIALFMHIVKQAEMTSDDLFAQYVGKNVLNFFRQDHGYKEGTYIKIWDGREDNEHLVEVLREIDSQQDNYADLLYAGLQGRYPQ